MVHETFTLFASKRSVQCFAWCCEWTEYLVMPSLLFTAGSRAVRRHRKRVQGRRRPLRGHARAAGRKGRQLRGENQQRQGPAQELYGEDGTY